VDLILEARDEWRVTPLGRVRQIKIYAPGYRALAWREVWERFAAAYPGQWAVQMFPPADRLVDGKAVYHLFVCEDAPSGLDIRVS
jgi:hypothetical protein